MKLSKKMGLSFSLIFLSYLSLYADLDQSVSIHQKEQTASILLLKGEEILPYMEKIAAVGLEVFRENPYLFEGTVPEYLEYLNLCIESDHGILILAEQDDKIVGLIWGVPIIDYTPDMIEMFSKHGIDPGSLFYLSGFSVLREYRQKNIGYALYKKFEEAVREQGIYPKITYCEVMQSPNAKKPKEYVTLDPYALKMGFVKQPDLHCYWSWKAIGSIESKEHPMVFWIKNLLP